MVRPDSELEFYQALTVLLLVLLALSYVVRRPGR